MHVVSGFILGTLASLPARDGVVTLCVAAMFAVGSGMTGFILTQIEKAKRTL
jgi:hypothetical protein